MSHPTIGGKMIRSLFFLLALATTAGCSTTSGQQPTSSRSGFDGARVVTIAPHGAACSSMLCPGLGAEWNSKRPDRAVISVAVFNAYTAINGAQLNIDGSIQALSALQSGTDFSSPGSGVRDSRRYFDVPLATVRAVAASKRTWLRVSTSSGAIEEAVIDGATDSKALHALKRFLAEVDAGG